MQKTLNIITLSIISLFITSSSFKDDGIEKKHLINILQTYRFAIERIHHSYVDDVDAQDLLEKSLTGMLEKLDPYSTFFNKKQLKQFNENSNGKFAGVGMTIEKDKETKFLKVIKPFKDSPAYNAGLLPQDLIVEVDGKETNKESLNDTINRIKGEIGTNVKFKVLRKNVKKPINMTLTRKTIHVPTIYNEILENKYIYLKINSFNQQTTKQINKYIKNSKKSVKDIKGYIIDMRGNPGGLLNQAVYISDLFLEEGVIVYTKSKEKEFDKRYVANVGDVTNGKKIVVLIDKSSASASEIVAAALKDHKRATLIGETTYGKGSVQSLFMLGDIGAMKFTISKYYTQSGKTIDKQGVEPNIKIDKDKIDKYHEKIIDSFKKGKRDFDKVDIENDIFIIEALKYLKNNDKTVKVKTKG